MPPNQHNQPPQPTPQPQRSFTPQAPHFDYNSAPHPQQFQQHPNGQYEVVPAPTPNNSRQSGHNPYDFIVNPNSHGTKVKKQQLALNKDVQTDALLANALTAGTYDTAVVQNLTSQLQTYEGLLKNTYNQTTGKSARELLQASYDSAAKLLEQAKALNSGNDQ
jgi:hypothetical protein